MATDNDDEFSGFFGDDSGGFFDEPQEPSSAPDTPESQEEAPPEEPDEDEDDGELNELAGTGAGTVARLNPEIRHQIMAQANSRAWTRHERHVVMRRAMSAGKLEEIIDWYPRSGQSIHILSCGEVDLFSYLHFMLRQRPYAYILLSTFSLGYMEIRNLHEYLEKGVIAAWMCMPEVSSATGLSGRGNMMHWLPCTRDFRIVFAVWQMSTLKLLPGLTGTMGKVTLL